ncbi:zf-HC2 domain-containing protein [Arthrobacter sp. MI7-26]|uniref:anti-sigma factor n=1 Tax=Arthrobacter sp. MI7-26 TaxID=2993653 RepID=UPI0022492FC7|nr:zf-HC2 domain-containing protein [Arthrobacter sp. MI7-26]MCX2748537.1 zf-HC2 domain-containing protein [Arthrobacter sp. MI7-26]
MNETGLHQLLGAYLLGGLEPDEARAFEEHLEFCADCRRELGELESLPALLDAVPVPDAVALAAGRPAVERPSDARSLLGSFSESLPQPILLKMAARRRKSRRRWMALVSAVAAACLGLGVLAGPLLNQPPKPDASYSVQTDNGLQLTVGLVRKSWGTELQLEGRSMPLQGTMYLWVKGRDGNEELACGWTATSSGHIKVTGATPVQLAGISGVELRDDAQKTVAVISVPGS